MRHLEINPSSDCYVPSLPDSAFEKRDPVKTVNGHSIESLEESSSFNRTCGCELDRLVSASRELRSFIRSDYGKSMSQFAKNIKKK